MKREVITTPEAPVPMAHYCQGVVAGPTIFAAGQIASDYKTGVAPEARQDPAFPYYGSNIQKQARYILQNLRGVFKAAGGTAVYQKGPLDRCLRDVLTMNQHVVGTMRTYEMAGRLLLGMEPLRWLF